MLAFYLIAAAVLLLLNAFFVLAEFAAVKVRGSKIEEMVNQGNARAKLVQHINENLDEYLSVCQVGITFASIALGFVGEPMAKMLIQPMVENVAGAYSEQVSHTIATVIGVFIVSAIHILFGEQIPKLIALRLSERAATWTAVPLRVSRAIFFVPLWLLNGASQLILRVFGLHKTGEGEEHSEDELRIILDRSQSTGVMSFRRLLFMENIFELGELKVVDAMRRRTSVRFLHQHAPWDMNLEVLRSYRYSRFPLLDNEHAEKPFGIIHVKDLLLQPAAEPDLEKLARPYLITSESTPLENLLADMQRRRTHVAIVIGAEGVWTGFITMEDIIEEIIGTVTDEFEADAPIELGDVITTGRIVLGVEAKTLAAAIRIALGRIPVGDLGQDTETVIKAVLERERIAGTYLGKGVALPHARIPGLPKPILLFIRSDEGIPVEGTSERANLLFVLLTPAGMARVHQRLQARIAGILENSEYVEDRLRNAETPAEVLDVIRTGEQASLD
ncbi:MAG: DUF21 domain-containing protein [Planctomycetes bacterium]|nr:DUF21 domain-containing protein [Planctomycetota bacterium]